MLGADRILWTRDGKRGPDDPNNSMAILLKWLTAEGNYTKYRGGPTSNGKGKLYWAAMISNEIKEAGVRKYRSPKAIKNKIMNLEDSFKSAHDWAGQTGAGVREEDPRHFKDYILKKCPYYYDLLDVMEDRSNSRPQLTTDNLGTDSSDDDASVTPNVDDQVRTRPDNNDEGKEDNDRRDEDDQSEPDATRPASNTPDATRPASTTPNTSMPSSSIKSSSSKKRPARTLPKKDDTVSSVINMQKEAIAEASRHNMQMEAFKKFELDCFLEEHEHKKKMARLNEKVALVDAYDKIKGKISDEQIRRMFPEMADLLENTSKKKATTVNSDDSSDDSSTVIT